MGVLEQLLERVAALEARLAELDKPAAALVTIREYAKARSIGQSTVRAAIREGRLRSVRIGRAVRIPADAEIARPVRQGETPAERADRVLARRVGAPAHVSAGEPEYVDDRRLELITPIKRVTWQLMRAQGRGPRWSKVGRRCVYRLAEVRAWIESQGR